MKPKYMFFYKSDNAVNDILNHTPFDMDNPIKIRKGRDESIIEYKYFDLFCIRIENPRIYMRGHRCWQILVEDILYDELDNDYIQDVLEPMMCVYGVLGGRIVKIDKYC